MKKIRNMQIAVALIILGMAGLVVVVLTADGSDDADTASSERHGDVPEFVDAFGPEAPGGAAPPIDRPSCERDERISWTEAERYVN